MRSGWAEIFLYTALPLVLTALLAALLWAAQSWRLRRAFVLSLNLRIYRLPLLVVALSLLGGLAFTVYYAEGVRSAAQSGARLRFLQQVDGVEAALQRQLAELTLALRGVQGLAAMQDPLTPQRFQAFVQASTAGQGLSGARAMGLWVGTPRPGQPQVLLSPGSLGVDVAADPALRAAAEASLRAGLPTLSARSSVLQQALHRPAFWYGSPVDGPGSARGWAFAPVVFSELMAQASAADFPWVDFQLFDAAALQLPQLVYDSAYLDGQVDDAASLQRHLHSTLSVVRPVMLGEQVLYLRVNAAPALEARFATGDHRLAAALGSGLSVLLAMVLWLLLAGRAQALEVARGLTQDLNRLAMVARRTSNAVFFTDTAHRITWVNEGFTRLTGYGLDEALGHHPGTLLESPLLDMLLQRAQAPTGDSAPRMQVLQQHKTAGPRWVDMEVQPLVDAHGRAAGAMALQSDITVEVEVKAALLQEKERAETILAGTNVGTWSHNLLTGEQQCNERWSAMLGFAPHEVLPDAHTFWQQRLHPIDRERLQQAFATCMEGSAESYACDLRAQRKDGSWMWILRRAKVLSRTAGGQVERIGGVHTDITETKQVELSLRDMEAFLDRAGQIAGVGAWQIDLQTRAVVFSAQTCALHGLAPDFQPSMEVALSFYPPAEQARLRRAVRRARSRGQSMDLVVEFYNAQGEQRWVRVFGEVGFDDLGPARLVGAFQDVTRDRLAQQEVARSGAILRGAIEAINEAFVLFDPQDRLVFCNDKYRAMYALSSDLMVEGASFESIIRGGAERGQYAEAVGQVDAWVAQRMAAHRSGSVTLEQRLQDGRWLKVLERRMPDGHMVGFRVDITELKLATAVAESISAQRGEEQRRLQSILEGTHVGTWEWNVQTGVSRYNEQYAAMLGYTLAELEPHTFDTWARLVHPDDLPLSSQRMQAHLDGARTSYEVEVRVRHRQGHWIWVLAKGKLASRSDDGRALWVFGTHMDITERKLAEQQLAQTTATLQNVLDSATAMGMLTLTLDQRISMFNKGAENLLGFAAQAVLHQSVAQRFFDPAELLALRETLELTWGREPSWVEVLDHVMAAREEQEWTLVRQDGSRFKASMLFSPLRDAQGLHVGHLALVYDVSKQKEYESSLREAKRLAEQSSVAKSQFLANMSHEIRTPMNAILGMLQLLRNTPLQPNQQDYAAKAAGAARSLLGLLNDILDFSKVEAGKMQLNPEPFVLEELLDDVSVILSSNLGAKNVDLVFELDPAIPPALVGDAMRLKQILINLGGNAVKFTEQGQVVIRWALQGRTPTRVRLLVEVQDTGIGIAPENQARIFEGFTQAEANTTRRFGGTGLGLVISTRLIRLMGGELQLHSALGQGSTFGFALDLAVPDAHASSALAAPLAAPLAHSLAPPAAHPKRVMLVDDNPVALAASAALVRSVGWEPLCFASGPAALVQLKADLDTPHALPEALFVDAHMPGMDGWETLRNVRRLLVERKVPPLVLLSRQSRDALAQRSDRERSLLDGLVVKPLTAGMLVRALAQAQGALCAPQPSGQAPSRPLQGMRVLLVEDNAINQQVAQELLSAEGAAVVLADNGALGVQALQAQPGGFDVVLMDLQMPVMDGLEATRVLRRDARFATLPIVAMTANAMEADRQECLQAGMNDHVGKPFDVHTLVQTLLTHTGWVLRKDSVPVAAPAALVAAPGAGGPVASDAAWPAAVDVDAALRRMGGNRALLLRSITAFMHDAQALPARLAQRAQAGDWPQVQRELHALKGLSATVGLQALSLWAGQAEKQMAATGPQAGYDAAYTALQGALAQALPDLQTVAGLLAPLPSPPPSASAAPAQEPSAAQAHTGEQLQALLRALHDSDMAAMELHATLSPALQGLASDAVQALDAAMAELDFEAAAQACASLVQQWDSTFTGA